MATYPNRNELYQEFPELEEEDIQQALAYLSDRYYKQKYKNNRL